MRVVLDTSVLLDAENPVTEADEVGVSAVTFAELHYGVLVARSADVRAERLSRLVKIRQLFEPLALDEKVAESYGLLAAGLTAKGRSPRPRAMDILIAATAHAHEAVLYTKNGKDFKGIEKYVTFVPV